MGCKISIALLACTASLKAVAASNVTDDASLFWGTYRPNLYFGLRPRAPKSLMTGLIWFGLNDFQSFSSMRHSCEQGDGLAGYTWTEHDVREGGVQVLKDPKNNVEITTEFLKFPGGEHGGSWAARIKGRPSNPGFPSKTSLIFYTGIEGLGSLELTTPTTSDGITTSEVILQGSSLDLGDFKMRFVEDSGSQHIMEGLHAEDFEHRLGNTHFMGRSVPDGTLWRAKEFIQRGIIGYAQPKVTDYQDKGLPEPAFVLTLPDDQPASSNFYAVQKSFTGEFSFDVYFESGSADRELDAAAFDQRLSEFKASFNERFIQTFSVASGPTPDLLPFSKAITSNLLGGIGYFHGTSIVDSSALTRDEEDDDDDAPGFVDDAQIKQRAIAATAPARELLTATPSRPFFPRGFYWDEGFHLALVGAWDNDLSMEILKSWINLIDDDGWVGREQILGEEARSKVPEEFQMQFPTYANPPTLTMAVTAFISRLKEANGGSLDMDMDSALASQAVLTAGQSAAPENSRRLLDPAAARDYLTEVYPILKRHYEWFRRTQRGQIKQWARTARSRTEGYRWRGRSEEHVLTSGLDDYPRPRAHVGELHVDLISWVGFFTRTMREIAEFLGQTDDEEELRKIESDIIANIDDLHWSEDYQMYCDASVDDDDESFLECHPGYVSLFPFLLGLLPPDSPHLGPILKLIRDPAHLWSPYGIRSLSASHPLFGKGENYWKGPIWIQMNYLALAALHKTYAAEPGPHQAEARKLYAELRQNVVKNVHLEYDRTGYVWEQYDPLTGEGRRSHPFTGWTSLVTLIISEKY